MPSFKPLGSNLKESLIKRLKKEIENSKCKPTIIQFAQKKQKKKDRIQQTFKIESYESERRTKRNEDDSVEVRKLMHGASFLVIVRVFSDIALDLLV